MVRGYEKYSPCEALTAAMMVATMSKTWSANMAIPVRTMKAIGSSRKINMSDKMKITAIMSMYSVKDNWKLSTSLPCLSTNADSSFFISQTMSGPIMLPKGMTKPQKFNRWQSMAMFFSVESGT